MSWECISYWIERHAGLASWVQAFGAVLSIWVAWWIASRQSKRAETALKQKDEAKCLALAAMIGHAMQVFETHKEMSNSDAEMQSFRNDLAMAKAILDGIDLFSLPDPDLIVQACAARSLVDQTVVKFNNHKALGIPAIVFAGMTASPAIDRLNENIQRCKEASKRFK